MQEAAAPNRIEKQPLPLLQDNFSELEPEDLSFNSLKRSECSDGPEKPVIEEDDSEQKMAEKDSLMESHETANTNVDGTKCPVSSDHQANVDGEQQQSASSDGRPSARETETQPSTARRPTNGLGLADDDASITKSPPASPDGFTPKPASPRETLNVAKASSLGNKEQECK